MEDREKPFIERIYMSSEDRVTQIKVGIFILIGLATVGLMVVYFGRLGEGFSSYYNVRVEFANASGLLRGCEVLLAGAKVGRVTNDPTILPDMKGVYVEARILEQVQIPVGSKFSIGSSGLLGDKYVEIALDGDGKESGFIKPDAVLKGTENSGGIAGVAAGAEGLISDLQTTVGNINAVVKKLDSTILSKEELDSISATMKNLQTATGRIADASKQIDTTLKSGKDTMDSAKKAADELQATLAALHKLIDQAKSGSGVLGTLISNRDMANNLRALILNLRKHGVLWYKDTSNPAAAGDSAEP
jgi:phospholipid/cholesterol/gamma-HCH transport system substrate-binding protein